MSLTNYCSSMQYLHETSPGRLVSFLFISNFMRRDMFTFISRSTSYETLIEIAVVALALFLVTTMYKKNKLIRKWSDQSYRRIDLKHEICDEERFCKVRPTCSGHSKACSYSIH